MFNLFKNKIELKNTNCLMSSESYQKGVKLGTEMKVPSCFECLIYNNNKYFSTLKEGNYKVEGNNFNNIIESQTKNGKKIKRVSFIAHYINKAEQKVEIKINQNKYNITFCIENTLLFAELILLYSYKVDNAYCISYLTEIFKDLLIYHHKNTQTINKSALKQYGINIISFEPANKSKLLTSSKPLVNNQIMDISSQPKQVEQPISSSSNSNSSHSSTSISCPNCGHIMKFSVTYCLKCGHKIK